jgi:uncharacterized protein YdeI (YjbR/CyaY-like superfamily)
VGTRDPRVDEYIQKQRDFAKPILKYLREVVHDGCPDCEETLKWGSPTFMYQGMLGGFAAFKEHAVFGFWKHENLLGADRRGAMGSLGRLTTIEDLPARKELLALIRKAMELNEKGIKAERMTRGPKKPIPMPRDFKAALTRSKKAQAAYAAFSPSHKREYLAWITEAKGADTRARRIKQAVEWIAEGKSRNWKYT